MKNNKRCIHRHTPTEHPKCFENLAPVNILIFDIETLPILAYTWGAWEQNIYSEQIVKDWCLLSYSAKWLNSSGIISSVLSPQEAINRDDKRLAKELWKLLEKADVIVGFNSKRFDIRKINARFLKYGLHKPSSYKHIDIILTARSVFGLTHNKLDFIAKFLGIQQKIETDFLLWKKCDEGKKSSLQKMREYNEMDVLIQEEIYFNMRDWIPNHVNLGLYTNLSNVCPVCLSKKYKEIGIYISNSKKYKEFRCECGAIWHDQKSIKP